MSSALHSFGNVTHYRKVTNSSSLKKRGSGKIHVNFEAVKRRKKLNGSKVSIQKGMIKKNNPFKNNIPSKKRSHKISENISRNEPVAKKAVVQCLRKLSI